MSHRRRTDSDNDIEPQLSPSQHTRVKRAHHTYEWRQAVARQAADRNPVRCICMIDPEIAPTAMWLPPESLDRRKDPKRAGAAELALYGLVRSMAIDCDVRRIVNGWLVCPETAPREPDVAWLYTWLGHRAPLDRVTCYRALLELRPFAPERAPKEPVKVHVYLDACGAHMWPSCSHSDLWRTTRPLDAQTKAYHRTGHWPETQAAREADHRPARRKRRRVAA